MKPTIVEGVNLYKYLIVNINNNNDKTDNNNCVVTGYANHSSINVGDKRDGI